MIVDNDWWFNAGKHHLFSMYSIFQDDGFANPIVVLARNEDFRMRFIYEDLH